MSRCFPFPPPGYVRNSAFGDALIESIKIEREKEKEKIKQEKKEQKRREKEERKKEKKEKREKEKGAYKRKRDGNGFDKSSDMSWVNSKKVHLQKKNEPEAEQFERSSLTEEHGQPILSESLSYSSDGTQSKTKKTRIERAPSDVNCVTQGKVIRFRLKRREPEHAQPSDDIPSTSGRIGTCQSCGVAPVSISLPAPLTNDVRKISKVFPQRPVEQLCLGATPTSNGGDTSPLLSSSVERTQKPKSRYEALFSEWLPRPIQCDGNEYEQWLYPCKKQAAQDGLSLKAYYDGVSGQRSSSLWPRAHLLPEVDLYALPFTVLY